MNEQTPRSKAIAALIAEFIYWRLIKDTRLEKLPEDNPEKIALRESVDIKEWVAKAIKDLRAQKKNPLRLATHPAKTTHSATDSSSLCIIPSALPYRMEVGSHCLSDEALDAVGNAAVLGVYKFLLLDVAGESLLSLLRKSDQDLLDAFGVSADQAEEWRVEFCKVQIQDSQPRLDALAKQVYWPVSPDDFPPDAHDPGHFHLLSVLNSSALAHWLYGRIQAHRFGDEAKAARQAKRDGVDHPHGYHDYPLLAEEKKGGTKPQNISQLNSERKGSNYLLASLPPQWDRSLIRPLYGVDSLFVPFGSQPGVRRLLRELRDYLATQPPEANNRHIRQRRDAWLDELFGELLQFGAAYSHSLPKGWSADSACRLPLYEQCWLDPYRTEDDADFKLAYQWQDWPAELAARFAHWLNARLGEQRLSRHQLSLGEAEYHYWQRELAHDLAWQRQLDSQRRDLDKHLPPAANPEEAQHAPA